MSINSIKNDEKIIFALRSIYDQYGYARYKMSKFEEYDLYVRNKDFLISDSIITFTDTNGKLMALKPDVTLSIVKNTRDIPGQVQKLYYNENIYRVSKGTKSFKEIMQVGLECIGEIDDYCIFEVLCLAAKSLKTISENSVLNISHLGVLAEATEGVPAEVVKSIYACISERNLHELRLVCREAGIGNVRAAMLEKLAVCFGKPSEVLPELKREIGASRALDQLCTIVSAFEGTDIADMLRIDFSVMSDMNYYNGIVFKGFIDGVPAGVLSGGQYDRLMRKMQRKSGAIGFAVYLDLLERLNRSEKKFDVDTVLLYDENCNMCKLKAAIDQRISEGESVLAQRNLPEKIRCRRLARFINGEVEIIEEYA